MTGDGAVVDPLQWRFDRRGGAGVWSGDDPLGAFQIVERHNAVVAHSRQQAAEIERLTRELDQCVACLNDRVAEKQASEARNAGLLKALERLGNNLRELANLEGIPAPERDTYKALHRDASTAIAAAKGETV